MGQEQAGSTTDRIEKQVVLRASRQRVWRAIADAAEFGAWFRVALAGEFAEGAVLRGHITYPGYEHLTMEVLVEQMVPEQRFSYRWHPYAADPAADYSAEPTTLVEFELSDHADGTLLTITESGFDQIPLARRAEAFRRNEGGWSEQTQNVKRHVEQS